MRARWPLGLVLAGLIVYARTFSVPFVFDVKDLWPDFPAQMGGLPRPLLPAFYRLERWLYHRAAHVDTLSPDMTAHVEAAGIVP